MPLVSVIIPLKNAERYLPDCLAMLEKQSGEFGIEILLIDSGSTDRTLEFARQSNARLITISPTTFNHGGTRNLGAQSAHPDSQYIAFLSQDALPLNETWLEVLIRTLQEDTQVAGAFSRHVPRPGASVSVVRQLLELTQTGGTQRLVKQFPNTPAGYETRREFYTWFSNTSSAIRRQVWEQHPFQAVNFAEDALWADEVLRAGYKIVFEPGSTVIHSHDYSLIDQLRQHVDHASAMQRLFKPPNYRNNWLWVKQFLGITLQVWQDVKYLQNPYFSGTSWGFKLRSILRSPLWWFATVSGSFIGAHLEALPDWLVKVFSRQERIRQH